MEEIFILAIPLILVLLMGIADYIRGMPHEKRPWFIPKPVAAFVIGFCATALGPYPAGLPFIEGVWVLLTVTVGMAAMVMMCGVGNAVGPAISGELPTRKKTAENSGPEWWQVKFLRKSTWLSLAALGFMWSFPALFLLLWTPFAWVTVVAFVVATPLAAFLAVKSVGGVVPRIASSAIILASETKRSDLAWATFNWLRSALAGALIIGLLHAVKLVGL